jgi:hypothetical protein
MIKADRFRKAFWAFLLLSAGVIHFGTAAVRINGFHSVDFSSYYAAASSIRLDISPYPFSPELLAFLAETQDMPEKVPLFNSPPLWAWLLQPLTVLPFPSAAALWLLILAGIVICCHILLAKNAGYGDWRIILATLPITVTFGPMFLNLTLGQNAAVILLSALIMGKAVRNRSRCFAALWIPSWIVAVAGKIFPVLWLACPPFLKRPRAFIIASGLCVAAFGGMAWLKPAVHDSYWKHFIINRAQLYGREGTGIDDQALSAYLNRIAKSGSFEFQGLAVHEKHRVIWDPPWEFSARSIHRVSAAVVALLGIWMLYSWIRSRNRDPEGELYSLILFTLIFFPHMQRYNHLLALPAMAWLWRRGSWGRNLTTGAYAVFALSRLNHAWAIYLPSTPASLASGFGLFGILMLFIGVTCSFLTPPRQGHVPLIPNSDKPEVIM